MPVLLGGQNCADFKDVAAYCAENPGVPTPWLGKVDKFENELGVRPGIGYVLMSRRRLDKLDKNGLHDLEVSITNTKVIHKNLVITSAEAILMASRDAPESTFLLEVQDRRRLAATVPIDTAYNVRSDVASLTYYSATLNGASPWTWDEMVEDVWDACGKLGGYPGLPFTPSGLPGAFVFYGGGYALDALDTLLTRLSCALKLDTLTDTFSIVQLAADDSITTALLDQLDDKRVWDTEPFLLARANVPETVQVFFPKVKAVPDTTGSTPWYSVDNTDPDPDGPLDGVEVGSFVTLVDDMPAVFDNSNSLTNGTDLNNRAEQRTEDYFRRARLVNLYRVYRSLQQPVPGSLLELVRWFDHGDGYFTALGRGKWLSNTIDELVINPACCDTELDGGFYGTMADGSIVEAGLVKFIGNSGGGGGSGVTLVAGSTTVSSVTNLIFSNAGGITFNLAAGGPGEATLTASFPSGTTRAARRWTAGYNIPNAVETAVSFAVPVGADPESYDVSFGSSYPMDHYSAPVDGIYSVGGYCYFSTGGITSYQIKINNATTGLVVDDVGNVRNGVDTSAFWVDIGDGDASFSAGDSITLTITQANLSTSTLGVEVHFWVHKIN